ncbi:hypothetical protein BDR04DRAFT_786157 [Suillus decipiens]|nr:hypothetical protein BDR04DRAFT_786157 [Suillus decipiens]
MEYSSDDIAGARSLQFTTYIYVSMATFWAYDYACSLHEEWTFLLRSDRSRVKCLYIVTRYLPFILLATNIYQYFSPNVTPDEFQRLDYIITGLGVISVICSEYFFILRTYVLWNNNKILLAAMLSAFFLGIHRGIYRRCLGHRCSLIITSAIPGITGSYRSSSGVMLFVPYLLLSVFELGLMILTLIPAIQSWRINSGPLHIVFMTHNIFYYTCGFLFSVANVFISLLLHYAYTATLHAFQFIILAILATRMHLHLWQTSRYADGSDTFVHIPMSDVSSVNFEV